MERLQLTITVEQDGLRLDNAIASFDIGLSKRKIRMVIDLGGVYLNKHRVRIASKPVRVGDKVEVVFQRDSLTTKQKASEINLREEDVLFHDRGLIAINKPPGLPSQATRNQSVVHAEKSLQNLLSSQGRPEKKLILLHRLDKDTSGILLFATNNEVATKVTTEFRERRVNKTYWAISYGVFPKQDLDVRCYLSPIDKKTGMVRQVRSGGKQSHTKFHLLGVTENKLVSWIECYPTTGRSHQIRVHLDGSGFPIVGDKRYGQRSVSSLPESWRSLCDYHFLHARELVLQPFADSEESVQITAEPPKKFQEFLGQSGLLSV